MAFQVGATVLILEGTAKEFDLKKANIWLSRLFCECGRLVPLECLRRMIFEILEDHGFKSDTIRLARADVCREPLLLDDGTVLFILLGLASGLSRGGNKPGARRLWEALYERWSNTENFWQLDWARTNILGETV